MRAALALAAALGLAACAAPPPPTPADPRLIVTPPVAAAIGVSEPTVSTLPDGRLRVVVNLRNGASADFPLRVQTDWLDGSGRPLSTLASRPQFRSVARGTVTTVDADAPNARARDFRMTLDVE